MRFIIYVEVKYMTTIAQRIRVYMELYSCSGHTFCHILLFEVKWRYVKDVYCKAQHNH